VRSKVEVRVCDCHGHSVPSHLRANAAAGDHRFPGAGCPRRDRSTMSVYGRALEGADRLKA
jgi:hypothetical protein